VTFFAMVHHRVLCRRRGHGCSLEPQEAKEHRYCPTIDADAAKLLTKHYGTDIEHIELGYHDYKTNVVEPELPGGSI
jgi:hypothetical protein